MTTKQIKETKFIKAIAEGKSKQQAGLIAGAKTPVAASKYANRMSKNVSVQQRIEKILKKQGITLESAIQPVADALQAQKIGYDKETGEYYEQGIADHTTRLQASKMALELLGAKNQQQTQTPQNTNTKEITEAIQKGDEIELYRLVFGKKTEETGTIINTKDTTVIEVKE